MNSFWKRAFAKLLEGLAEWLKKKAEAKPKPDTTKPDDQEPRLKPPSGPTAAATAIALVLACTGCATTYRADYSGGNVIVTDGDGKPVPTIPVKTITAAATNATQTTAPDSSSGTATTTPVAVATSAEAEMGFSHPYMVTCELAVKKLTRDHVYFTGTKRGWESPKNDGCVGEAHLYIYRDGKWQGGKFDHIRELGMNGSLDRDFANLAKGYGAFKGLGYPWSGERVAFVVVSYKESKLNQRSNAAFSTWP